MLRAWSDSDAHAHVVIRFDIQLSPSLATIPRPYVNSLKLVMYILVLLCFKCCFVFALFCIFNLKKRITFDNTYATMFPMVFLFWREEPGISNFLFCGRRTMTNEMLRWEHTLRFPLLLETLRIVLLRYVFMATHQGRGLSFWQQIQYLLNSHLQRYDTSSHKV